MSKLISVALSGSLIVGSFVRASCRGCVPVAAAADCAFKAVGKDGKPLSGAAKSSFMKKCEADAKSDAATGLGCAEKAIDKNGKPLAGAAKDSFMKKCEAGAKSGK